jgi:hypothetical protein
MAHDQPWERAYVEPEIPFPQILKTVQELGLIIWSVAGGGLGRKVPASKLTHSKCFASFVAVLAEEKKEQGQTCFCVIGLRH